MENHTAFISIGSNIGDKLDNCRKAVEIIDFLDKISVLDVSKYYKTEPVDFLDQDWFINAAVKIETSFKPDELLRELRSVEKAVGTKKKAVRFGPRVLDLDIIFYDDFVIEAENLKIPHPRMHQRRFVLQPLSDIVADFIHPVLNLSVKKLFANLDSGLDSSLDNGGQKVLEIICD